MPRPDAQECRAVVLAAGAATRFQGVKLLASFRGRPLVCWPVAAALASRVKSVTVVLGSEADAITAALEPLADNRLSLVRCERWRDGLSASLKHGLAALPSDTRAALIFLGDMPNLDPSLADRVLVEVLGGAPAAFPQFDQTPGHPVALSSSLFPAIGRLEGDQGAQKVLTASKDVVHIMTNDPGCIDDVDTRRDLKRLDPTEARAT